MSREAILTGLAIGLAFWAVLWGVRWIVVNVGKDLLKFYFEKRMSFLEEMEKKFDGDREELARKVFN